MIPWTLGQLRSRLPDMLRHAGGATAADTVTSEIAHEAAERVESHLRTIGELE